MFTQILMFYHDAQVSEFLVYPSLLQGGQILAHSDIVCSQVTYSWSLGRLLHTTPLALVLIAITSLCGGDAGRQGSVSGSVSNVFKATLKQFSSLFSAVLLTTIAGVLRTVISGLQSLLTFLAVVQSPMVNPHSHTKWLQENHCNVPPLCE